MSVSLAPSFGYLLQYATPRGSYAHLDQILAALPMPNRMNDEQLLAEIEDLLRTMPAIGRLHSEDVENYSWLGRFKAFVEAWNLPQTISLAAAIRSLHSG